VYAAGLRSGGRPHGGFRAEAEASWTSAAAPWSGGADCRQHLQLLLKRDVKDWPAAHVTPRSAGASNSFAPRSHPAPLQPRANPPHRADVVFVKRGAEWAVSMNEEDLPASVSAGATGTCWSRSTTKRSRLREGALPLRNPAHAQHRQRKSTILRTCEVIVRRQQDFLEIGVEGLRP